MDVDQAKNNPAVQMIDALQRVLKKGQLLDGGTGLWKRKPEWSRLFQSFSADYHLFRRLANETCFQSDDGPSKKVTSIMSKIKVRKCLPSQKIGHSQLTFCFRMITSATKQLFEHYRRIWFSRVLTQRHIRWHSPSTFSQRILKHKPS